MPSTMSSWVAAALPVGLKMFQSTSMLRRNSNHSGPIWSKHCVNRSIFRSARISCNLAFFVLWIFFVEVAITLILFPAKAIKFGNGRTDQWKSGSAWKTRPCSQEGLRSRGFGVDSDVGVGEVVGGDNYQSNLGICPKDEHSFYLAAEIGLTLLRLFYFCPELWDQRPLTGCLRFITFLLL